MIRLNLSNRPEWLDLLPGLRVLGSATLGVRKPDPRIYQMMCEALGTGPESCIYLDDLGINCKPASALGMHAIKVTSGEQALADLSAALGIPLP